MVGLPLELPNDVVVYKTFLALNSDFSHDPVKRAQSCPPRMSYESELDAEALDAEDTVLAQPLAHGPKTLFLHHFPLRGRLTDVTKTAKGCRSAEIVTFLYSIAQILHATCVFGCARTLSFT